MLARKKRQEGRAAIKLLEEIWFFQNLLSGGRSIVMDSPDVNNAAYIRVPRVNYKKAGEEDLEKRENNNESMRFCPATSLPVLVGLSETKTNNQKMDSNQEELEEEEEEAVIPKPRKKSLLRCYTSLVEKVGARTSSTDAHAPHIKGRHHERKLSAEKIAQRFLEGQRSGDNFNFSPTKRLPPVRSSSSLKKMDGNYQEESTPTPATPTKPTSSKRNLLRCYTSLAEQKVVDVPTSSRDHGQMRHCQSPHKSGSKQQRPPRDGISTEIGTSRHDRRRQQQQRNHPVHKDENFERFVDMRKWKSFSDLEHEEVQGFKDLGFVFDNSTGVSKELLNVIPGLREKDGEERSQGCEEKTQCPSEAWLLERSMPSIEFQSGNIDVREKLRFWARAVASNVRQKS